MSLILTPASAACNALRPAPKSYRRLKPSKVDPSYDIYDVATLHKRGTYLKAGPNEYTMVGCINKSAAPAPLSHSACCGAFRLRGLPIW